MPTVPSETEALHYFRAAQALVCAVVGTAMVLLAVPVLSANYLWLVFAAITAIFVIVPSILALRRASRNRPAEPTVAFHTVKRNWALIQIVFAVLMAISARSWGVASHMPSGHIFVVLCGLYIAAAAWVLRFPWFYAIAFAIWLSAPLPMHFYDLATASSVSLLAAGLLFWLASFLVFSRKSQ